MTDKFNSIAASPSFKALDRADSMFDMNVGTAALDIIEKTLPKIDIFKSTNK